MRLWDRAYQQNSQVLWNILISREVESCHKQLFLWQQKWEEMTEQLANPFLLPGSTCLLRQDQLNTRLITDFPKDLLQQL